MVPTLNSRQFSLGFCIGLMLSIGVTLWKFKQAEKQSTDTVSKQSVKEKKKLKKNAELKMVIVVPKDIQLTKRELICETVNACIGAFKESWNVHPNIVKHWIRWGQAKVTVKVNNEAELLTIREAADREQLISFLVRDRDVSKNNARVLAIGPDVVEDINVVTGHLKLL